MVDGRDDARRVATLLTIAVIGAVLLILGITDRSQGTVNWPALALGGVALLVPFIILLIDPPGGRSRRRK